MLFGEAPISIETLAAELRVRIREIAALQLSNPDGNRAYTIGVKTALEEIGNSRKLRTIRTDRTTGIREFMLDVVWWAETPEGQWAAMGAESEWGNPRSNDAEYGSNQVVEDFEKLRCFKAPLKLLFFSAEDQAMREMIHGKIQAYLRQFAHHVQGEQYLFMEFTQDECYSYTWSVVEDGRCPNASLVPMDEKSTKALQRGMAAGA